MEKYQFTYAFDALCGWCYGFAPALHRFAADNADRIHLQVLSGGLFTGHAAGPLSAYPHIPDANDRIAELTGVRFGEQYRQVLSEGSLVMDSTAPAMGLAALRRQAPERALEFAGAIQEAWYEHGQDLREPEVYRSIAVAHGLDADALASDWADPGLRAEVQEEFQSVRRLGVHQYPTLLLHTPAGPHRLGGPVSTADALTAALDSHIATATP